VTKKQTDKGKDVKNMTTEEEMEQEKECERNKNEPKKTEAKPMEMKECWFWTNRKCKFGDRCKDKHPTLCTAVMESGKCTNNR